MDKRFLLLVALASATAFTATWVFESRGPKASENPFLTPAAAAAAASGKQLHFDSCDQVRKAGMAPLFAGRPGWNPDLDPSGTGVACPPLS